MTIVRKMTPVLIVDAIEPSLPLWESLGFVRTVEIPHGESLGFVVLATSDTEIMYQTSASLREDIPAYANSWRGDKTVLFVEVENIDAIETLLPGLEVIMPRRQTFYGSTELGVREPGGHIVTFAQMKVS